MFNLKKLNLGQLTFTLLIVCLTAFTLPANAENNVSTAWDKINHGATVIDVRTADEFATGHVEGAINIPFEDIVPELAKLKLDKTTDLVLYCRSGRRSGIALDALKAEGYSKTLNAGGYEDLIKQKP